MNSRIYTARQGLKGKVSKQHKAAVEVLKDLIRVNRDRITGYEKAGFDHNQASDNLFERFALESRAYVNALHAEVVRLGGTPVGQDTITGNIYLLWLDQKVDFSNPVSCESGELAIQKVYKQALEQSTSFPENVVRLMERQLGAFEQAQNELVYFLNAEHR